MATEAQLSANQLNAQKSCGATSAQGKQISSQNSTTHGLTGRRNQVGGFYFLSDEDSSKFEPLVCRLVAEFKPQVESEFTLVRHMAEADWLRSRALRLQNMCLRPGQHVSATEQFGLYMRYHAMHERTYYKALKELQALQERREAKAGAAATAATAPTPPPDPQPASAAPTQVAEKEAAQPEIGFVSQKGVATPEVTQKPAPPPLETVEKTVAAPQTARLDTSGGFENAA